MKGLSHHGEPEQVSVSDTWRDGIQLLNVLSIGLLWHVTFSVWITVQIGDENVHRVRAVLDEFWGREFLRVTSWEMSAQSSQLVLVCSLEAIQDIKFESSFSDKAFETMDSMYRDSQVI